LKIDTFTVTVLENFAAINPATWINEGSLLETVSQTRAIIARVNVDTVFPKSFGLYRLSHLIQTLGIYNEPDVSFEDTHLLVSSGMRSTKIAYGDPALFEVHQKVKSMKFPTSNIKTSISSVVLRDLDKAVRILGVPDIVIEGDGKEITICATKVEDVGSNYHSIRLGDTDQTFKAVIKHQNLIFLPEDYEVEVIASKKTPSVMFIADRVKYQVALDESSKL
jgi:hypothetical protein